VIDMALDQWLLQRALGARGRVLDTQHRLYQARADYEHLIRRLVAAGGTERDVAAALGIRPYGGRPTLRS
jgi:hypothetical protein